MASQYPWYESVTGDDIEQGDIIAGCLMPILPPDFSQQDIVIDEETGAVRVRCNVAKIDVIVMSQSCDIARGQDKVPRVLLCQIKPVSAYLNEPINKDGTPLSRKAVDAIRKQQHPALHMIDTCDLDGLQRECSIVNFQEAHTLPISHVRELAGSCSCRARLAPPYKEHLSQAFARFLMRVGIPSEIAPFV